MLPGAQTALSEDAAQGSASRIERRRLGMAETTAGGSVPALPDAATYRSDDPQPVMGPLPAQIGRYQVVRSLGAGGMGEVVLARDPELDRRVAIKLLKPGRAQGDSQARLLREAQAMARLSHPNVVQIHDVGMVGDRVFLAMELIEGETLARWLARRRSWREVVRVFVDAGRGLAAAHAAGLVHRDFKPDNVLLGADGRARVADFGLARGERGEEDERAGNFGERPLLVHTLTATGVVMGTPLYMSPEQHLGEPAGPASDIFSFSVALYEALYGARPFAGETMAELAGRVIRGELTAPPAGHGVPAWLEAVVRRGMAKEAGDRWPDFPTLLAALDRDPARTKRRIFAGLGLGLAAGALGATLQASAGAEVCEGGAASLAAVWDASTSARVGAKLGDGAPRVIAGLDEYAAGWTAMHREVCLAHRQGETSAALLDAGMRCLEQRREALAEAARVIAGGDEAVAREAAVVVARLPALAGCADAEALGREVPPPADAAVAARVEELRLGLVRARVLANAGRPAEAQAAIAAIRGEAEAIGYGPLTAAAWLAEGRAALDAYAPGIAGAAFDAAFVAATAAGEDAVAAEARARQLYVDGVMAGRLVESLAARRHAEALVSRLGGRRDLEGLLANNIGGLLYNSGDPATAGERFEYAVARTDGDPRTDPIDRSGYMSNAARVAADSAARDGLNTRAVALLEGALGPDHPMTLRQRVIRAMQGEVTQAAALLSAVGPPLLAGRRWLYELCVEAQRHRGYALDELGRPAEAATAIADAEACLDAPIAADSVEPMAAMRELVRGLRLAIGGEDPEAALAALTAAAAAYQAHVEIPSVAGLLAEARLGAARVHLARGEDGAARDLLVQVIDAPADPMRGYDWQPPLLRARARRLLAEVLLRDPAGDRARARALLDEAEAVYRAAGAGQEANLAAVAAVRARAG